MRAITAALASATRATITSPVFLIEITGMEAQPIRWSTGADWATFASHDASVKGISIHGDKASIGDAYIEIGNLDGAAGLRFMAGNIPDARCRLWVADERATGAQDSSELGTWSIGGVSISMQRVAVALRPVLRHVPRRMVNAAWGFNSATPIGTRINWAGEVYILE
jgi:hypothetical protein